jgi:hypothetical protein
MTTNSQNACKLSATGAIITPKGRLTFAAVAERFKKKGKEDDKGNYAVCICFPPDADLTLLKNAVLASAKEKFGDKIPKGLKSPFRDAGESGAHGHIEGWTMFRPNTFNSRPGVVGPDGKPLDNLRDGEDAADVTERLKTEVYAGRWARLAVPAVAKFFDVDGNKGFKFYLNNIQVLDHDEPLRSSGGRGRAEDDFGEGDAGGVDPNSDNSWL